MASNIATLRYRGFCVYPFPWYGHGLWIQWNAIPLAMDAWRQKDPADVINAPNQLTLSGLKEYCSGWVWPSEMNPLNEDPQTLSY